MNKKKPNIVICLTDQLRPFELGCHGHRVVRTPHIDAMAERGVRFEMGCANSPLCVPARHIILSGQTARTCMGTNSNYISFPPSEVRDRCLDPMLPEVLQEAGYRTGVIGKWHIYPTPQSIGFEESLLVHNLHRHRGQSFYDKHGNREEVRDFSLEHESRNVRDFLAADDGRPFFLYYTFSPPHSPLCDAPEKYLNMYSREEVQLRPNVFKDGKPAHNPERMRAYMWDYLAHLPENLEGHEATMTLDYEQRIKERPLHGLKRVYRDVMRLLDDPVAGPVIRREMPYLDYKQLETCDLIDIHRFYYGMVTCIDDYMGKFFQHLEELGLSDNTIVVFTSDHGDMIGSHQAWMKSNVYEEALRVPFIIQWPERLKPAHNTRQIASIMDVMPTVLSLAGVDIPATVEGQDLKPILFGETDELEENQVFIDAYVHRRIGIRTPTHMYAIPMEGDVEQEWTPSPVEDGKHLFFDLRDDPFQMNNLIDSGQQQETMIALRNALLDWNAKTVYRKFD